MNGFVKSVSGLFFFLLLLHIPVVQVHTPASINPVYNHEVKNQKTIRTTMDYDLQEYVYHLPVSGNFNASHQYEIHKLSKLGESLLSFKMPLDKDISLKEVPEYTPDKEGFITYPDNGSFFLWYPRLGTHTFFYDQDGQFLWAHKSSHYMRAFPSGKYILSMTGDHSRAFYMLPDLSVMGSTEGTLLINQQFSNETLSDDSMQVCLGFLDGDIVMYNPAKKHEIRVGSQTLTKSIACNFHKLQVLVQAESADKNIVVDQVKLGQIKAGAKGATLDWKFTLPLLDRYTSTLPMGLTDDYGIVLLPEKSSLMVLAFDVKGKILYQSVLSKENTDDIEEWRIYPSKKGLVAWNPNEIYIFNPQKIFEKKMPIENVTVKGDEIFIQNREQVLALRLTE